MTRQDQSQAVVEWMQGGLADRETMLAGTLGWLLDPGGDHGLGDALRTMLHRIGVPDIEAEEISVVVEAPTPRGRRIDLLLKEAGEPRLALELKCKSGGTAKQLERYAADGLPVARVAHGEWNFELSEEQQGRFRLVTFEKVCEDLRAVAPRAERYRDLIESVADHLASEAKALRTLWDYYLNDEGAALPDRPGDLTIGDRFLNKVFWKEFRRKLERDGEENLTNGWRCRADRSGVWFAGGNVDVGPDEVLDIRELCLQFPGPFRAWVHLEILGRKSLFGREEKVIGRAQLRLRNFGSADHVRSIYRTLKSAKPGLKEEGFKVPGRRPSVQGYTSAITKPLARKDLRYSCSDQLLAPFGVLSKRGAAQGGARRP